MAKFLGNNKLDFKIENMIKSYKRTSIPSDEETTALLGKPLMQEKIFHENLPKEIKEYCKKKLKLNKYNANINIMKPATVCFIHIDNHEYTAKMFEEEIKDFRRILVFLNDWSDGQCFGYGTNTLTDWKAGDTYTVGPNESHWAANAGTKSKYTLVISVWYEELDG